MRTAPSTAADLLAPSPQPNANKLVAIASGKGGVGKTWLAITIAHALARRGRRTLLFDADLGLANVDIQLGLMPSSDLGGVVTGRLTLAQATTPFPAGGFDIIAGRSGCGRLAGVPRPRLPLLGQELLAATGAYDHVLLDLGAGLEWTVRQFSQLAGSCAVVTTDEPTAITDAYAFIKMAQIDRTPSAMRIIVNMAASRRDGERTFGALLRACESFLKVSPELLGVVRRDLKVREAIRCQTPLLTRFPTCEAAAEVEDIASRIAALSARQAS